MERAPVPVPAPGEVLIAVHAAAITFDELTWDETWLRDGVDRTPVIPSHEVSGVVAAVTDDVTDFAVGDEVYGLIRFDRDGAAADYVTVPAADLATRPTTVSHVVSAALPLAGLTAWQALVDHAKVQPGERVLVLGGAGGVGALTVQVAHSLGAEVTATVRGDVADVVREFGRRPRDRRSHRADRGTLVRRRHRHRRRHHTRTVPSTMRGQAGAWSRWRRLPRKAGPSSTSLTATFFIVTPDRDQLRELAGFVDGGRLHVAIADDVPTRAGPCRIRKRADAPAGRARPC